MSAIDAFDFDLASSKVPSSRIKRFIWIFQLFKSLIKYRKSYDVLHLHLLWWGGLLVAVWSSLRRIPALYESVLLDADTPRGILQESFGTLKVWCLKKFRGILAISTELANEYLDFGFSGAQVHTLMNCIDSDLFCPSETPQQKAALRSQLGIPSDAIVLVFVGSVVQRKGVDILIKAFADASALDPRLYLIVIGPRNRRENPALNEKLVEDLYREIAQFGISDRVVFTGLIEKRDKLSTYYRASDIFVFPSRNEGLPNVILEAMATGLPAIVTRLPGLERVVTQNESGLFVPVGDAGLLTNSIIRLSDDPVLAQKLGDNARCYIELNHSFVAWQQQMVEIYLSIR
jgi:glycosyltransferase involved in cell wall biosynthesis